MPLLTANDLCAAMETILADKLSGLASSRGLKPVTAWDQLPTSDALTSANVPVGAIASPGLTDAPVRRSTGIDATWRVVVAVYDRGRDYVETAKKVRDWAAVVRQVVIQNPTLGGVASGLVWVGEEYTELPERPSARTLGGCAVAFDVTARNVIDAKPYTDPATDDPTVQSTHRTITVRPLNQE
jgi:hypothetical protein